jgi:hypothetical protein
VTIENMGKGEIYSRIVAVMADVGAIAKDKRNTQQSYNFRGIDDVYNELHNTLAKHGVFTVPYVLDERSEERPTRDGKGLLLYRVLKIRYRFYAPDGSFVTAVLMGEGMDSGDKASNKAQAVAHKYALLQVFAIPTEEPKDPEVDSPEVGKGRAKAPPVEAKAAPKPQGKSGGAKVAPFKFDKTNRAHLQLLATALEGRGVAVEYHDDVALALDGRQNSEIDQAIAEVKERKSGAAAAKA